MEKKLLIQVVFVTKPEMRQEFIQKCVEQGVISGSNAEEGCRKYDFHLPLDSEENVFLLEIWDSVEAHRLHTQTPHYQRLDVLKAEYVAETKVVKNYITDFEQTIS